MCKTYDKFFADTTVVVSGFRLGTATDPAADDVPMCVFFSFSPPPVSRPGMLDPKGKAKWDAWKGVEGKAEYTAGVTSMHP